MILLLGRGNQTNIVLLRRPEAAHGPVDGHLDEGKRRLSGLYSNALSIDLYPPGGWLYWDDENENNDTRRSAFGALFTDSFVGRRLRPIDAHAPELASPDDR